jgi:hypothetical protein
MLTKADEGGRRGFPWRIVGWGTAVLILSLPLVAMQFTRDVNWTVGDYIFAVLLIGGTGLAFELTVRATRNSAYRAGVAFALAASFLTVWANGAVGMIGDEGNPYNLLFLGVVGLALAGAVIARFRASGMVLAMATAAVAHGSVAVIGMFSDLLGGVLSTAFAGLWLLSAVLFWKAAREQADAER